MDLSGKVALVAGATRGAGRGIAIEQNLARLDCREREASLDRHELPPANA